MKIPPRSIELTKVYEWNGGCIRLVEDSLAVEEPLEIRINGWPMTVTMRTPGHDHELAVGCLLSEGIVESVEDFTKISSTTDNTTGKSNVVELLLTANDVDRERFRRNFTSSSSCGICGRASIEAIRMSDLSRLASGLILSPELLCGLPDKLRHSQAVFSRTGGLHAAALFDANGEMIVLREDIGRHNAVDKVIGWALLEGRLPLSGSILVVSGRGGFEIVQKALAAGIPVLASVSAPSSLGVQLARQFGLTLVGFLRGRRFVVYSGEHRCRLQETAAGLMV